LRRRPERDEAGPAAKRSRESEPEPAAEVEFSKGQNPAAIGRNELGRRHASAAIRSWWRNRGGIGPNVPEHTLAAYELGAGQKAPTAVECDVRLTRDGPPGVGVHDRAGGPDIQPAPDWSRRDDAGAAARTRTSGAWHPSWRAGRCAGLRPGCVPSDHLVVHRPGLEPDRQALIETQESPSATGRAGGEQRLLPCCTGMAIASPCVGGSSRRRW